MLICSFTRDGPEVRRATQEEQRAALERDAAAWFRRHLAGAGPEHSLRPDAAPEIVDPRRIEDRRGLRGT
jgi:hypothetical protein